jgi:DNA-binding MarR family transcriptional regulator
MTENFAPIHLYDDFPQSSLAETFELIDRTAKNLKRIQRQTVRVTGLTPPQFSILHLLWEKDARPFKEFADALLCTRATITGIIDTLERKGLVTRKTNPADRRSILATLTYAGRELQHRTPSLDRVYNSCCSGLSPQELQQIVLLLTKLNDSLIFEE